MRTGRGKKIKTTALTVSVTITTSTRHCYCLLLCARPRDVPKKRRLFRACTMRNTPAGRALFCIFPNGQTTSCLSYYYRYRTVTGRYFVAYGPVARFTIITPFMAPATARPSLSPRVHLVLSLFARTVRPGGGLPNPLHSMRNNVTRITITNRRRSRRRGQLKSIIRTSVNG